MLHLSTKAYLYSLIDQALSQVGSHLAKIEVSESAEGLSRIANSEIHQNVYEEKTTMTVSIYGQRKVSRIITNLLSAEGIKTAVLEAVANLELLPDGEEQPELVSSPPELESQRFNQELHDTFTVGHRVQLISEALSLIQAPYKAYGQLSYRSLDRAIGNSAGIRRFSSSNQVSFSLLVSDDLGGTGFASQTAQTPHEVDLGSVAKIALEKAMANKDPIELNPGAYTVILEPQAVSDLMLQGLIFGFSGTMIANKASFLTDRIGEKLFCDSLHVVDDWSDPLVAGDPFDAEGMPRQKLTLIEAGVAKAAAFDQISARKVGVEPTGHAFSMFGMNLAAPTNVVFAPGDKPLAQIIAETDKALLVTRFHYMNAVNPRQALLTGLTRDGFFMIENGKITKALRNMRFTESILLAFNNIEAIASDRWSMAAMFGALCMPGMKISNFHFTGKTSLADTKGTE